MKFIATKSTAAKVNIWATQGNKRLRKKYKNSTTACRILNRRECPIVAESIDKEFGIFKSIKVSWGDGYIKNGSSGLKNYRFTGGDGKESIKKCIKIYGKENNTFGWYGNNHEPNLFSVSDLRKYIGTLAKPEKVNTCFDYCCSKRKLKGK